MRRTRFLLFALCAPLAFASGATAQRATLDTPDVLERTLPGVVTVAVAGDGGAAQAFGFGAEAVRAGPADHAYAGPLPLANYTGTGSGFVLDRGGRRYVVTNAHVIERAGTGEVYVYSLTRESYRMRLVGADTYWDVAVLAFEDAPGAELDALRIDTRELRIGTPVFAVGNPLGRYPYTVTSGIVSGLNRGRGGFAAREGYVQTDANILFGNSGGPLIGADGAVVGMNTAIGTVLRTIQLPVTYIAFSLNAARLERVVDDIIVHGRVARPYIGVYVEQRRAADGSMMLVVADTLPGSPGARALGGVLGWTIASLNGEWIGTAVELLALLEQAPAGVPLRFVLWRGADRREIEVVPEQLDSERLMRLGRYFAEQRLGLSLVAATESGTPTLRVLGAGTEPPRRWRVYTPRGDALVERDAQPELAPRRGEAVLQAGYVDPQQRVLWRLQSLEQLGIIARMVTPFGWFSVVLGSADDWRVVTQLVYASSLF